MTAPTWKHFDPVQQWEEFKRSARELTQSDLRAHSDVGTMCGCRNCFCCAAREVYMQREEETKRRMDVAFNLKYGGLY